ncbi:uncharacterized protein LOC116956505 isoform X1 [Petromyzon marinus]|uniref:uncharacterized protein LOC116956505 isoform X1 n=1 Tax=Petromyzon marinus TaxID=7757 RepID=UPI003F6F939F
MVRMTTAVVVRTMARMTTAVVVRTMVRMATTAAVVRTMVRMAMVAALLIARGSSAQGAVVDAELRRAVVDAHNELRGQVDPPAADMMALVRRFALESGAGFAGAVVRPHLRLGAQRGWAGQRRRESLPRVVRVAQRDSGGARLVRGAQRLLVREQFVRSGEDVRPLHAAGVGHRRGGGLWVPPLPDREEPGCEECPRVRVQLPAQRKLRGRAAVPRGDALQQMQREVPQQNLLSCGGKIEHPRGRPRPPRGSPRPPRGSPRPHQGRPRPPRWGPRPPRGGSRPPRRQRCHPGPRAAGDSGPGPPPGDEPARRLATVSCSLATAAEHQEAAAAAAAAAANVTVMGSAESQT